MVTLSGSNEFKRFDESRDDMIRCQHCDVWVPYWCVDDHFGRCPECGERIFE